MNGPEIIQTPEAKAAFDARWQRVMDCVQLKSPDRMPITFMHQYWMATYGGVTYNTLLHDCAQATAITERAAQEFQPDAISPVTMSASWGNVLEKTDFRQLEWPGHGIGDNQCHQYIDKEYVSAEELDEFLDDPTGFWFSKFMPRVAGVWDGLQPLAALTGSLFLGLAVSTVAFAQPGLQQTLERLRVAGEEAGRLVHHHVSHVQRLAALGFPTSYGLVCTAPYDTVADTFRGATAIMKDLFRRKDKLLAVIDKMGALTLRQMQAQARMTSNPIVFIPIHWGPDPFMSGKQFETFYWPSLRKLMLGLIDAGLIPMPFWESDCTKRLEVIRDIPPGKCIYWFESTDLVRAHEVLGDVVALRGNVSNIVLSTGTPDDVDKAVRRLVEGVYQKGGKLILDGAGPVPDETSVANIRAMFAAARKYSS